MATQWTLEDLYSRVFRSWWVLVTTIVVAVIGAVGVYAVYPQTYTAIAQHTVEPISVLSSGSSFNTVNMETERIVATSTAVLDRASASLGGANVVGGLRASTEIEIPRNSQVLVFQVTTGSSSRSAAWANALALAYGEQRSANARAVVEQASGELTTSIDQLRALMAAQEDGSATRAATEQQLQALLDQQVRLTATPIFSGILVTPAVEPDASNRPGLHVFIAAGLFLGLLLGTVLALFVSRLRSSSAAQYRRGRRQADRGNLSTLGGFSTHAASETRGDGAAHPSSDGHDHARAAIARPERPADQYRPNMRAGTTARSYLSDDPAIVGRPTGRNARYPGSAEARRPQEDVPADDLGFRAPPAKPLTEHVSAQLARQTERERMARLDGDATTDGEMRRVSAASVSTPADSDPDTVTPHVTIVPEPGSQTSGDDEPAAGEPTQSMQADRSAVVHVQTGAAGHDAESTGTLPERTQNQGGAAGSPAGGKSKPRGGRTGHGRTARPKGGRLRPEHAKPGAAGQGSATPDAQTPRPWEDTDRSDRDRAAD